MFLLNRFMPIPPAPLGDLPQRPAYPFPRCFPLNHPVSLSGFPPVMGEPEKIKGVGPFTGILSWTGKGHQSGLLRVQRKSESRKPLWEHFQHLFSILSALKSQYHIISEANHENRCPHPWLHLLFEPLVQNIVKVNIAEQRRDTPTLGCTALRILQGALFHHPCIEPFVNKSGNNTISHPVPEKRTKMCPIKRIEKLADIQVNDVAYSHVHTLPPKGIQRIMRATAWSKPIRAVNKILLIDRFQYHPHCSLQQLILGGRDSD